jgi:uncharacterized integral membrane protein
MGVGAAIAGPICLLLHEAVLSLRAGVSFGSVLLKESESFAQQMILIARYGLIAYLPFMWVHALATGFLAQRGRDGFVWSALSAGVLSIPVAAFVTWETQSALFQRFDWISLQSLVLIYLPFIVTGLVIGLLYWRIAVWPWRQWRRQMESSEAAIRAME